MAVEYRFDLSAESNHPLKKIKHATHKESTINRLNVPTKKRPIGSAIH